MKPENIIYCPCGCGEESATPTGLGDTPFVSRNGIKVPLASWGCIEKMKNNQLEE